MRWMNLFVAVLCSGVTGCSGLIQQAPAFLPSLERCQNVTYQRNGQMASLTLSNCTVPTGELAR